MVVLFWQGVGAGHEGNVTNNLVHDTWLRAGGELYMYSGKTLSSHSTSTK